MSPAKQRILKFIVPLIEDLGFRYVKSQTRFVLKSNDLNYIIQMNLDGRGGTSMIDSISYYIESPAYNKKVKLLVGNVRTSLVSNSINCVENNKLIIPMPFSKHALDLSNNMNLTEIGQLTLEEKYPEERLIYLSDVLLELVKNRVLPFFSKYSNISSIYKLYSDIPYHENNPLQSYYYKDRWYMNKLRALYIILISHDLGKDIPLSISRYSLFYDDMISAFCYLGKVQNLKEDLNDIGIKFYN